MEDKVLDKLGVLATKFLVLTISTLELVIVFAIFCFILAAFGFV